MRDDATLVPFQSLRRTKENKTSDAIQKNVTANEENVGGAVRSAPRWPVISECVSLLRVRGSQRGECSGAQLNTHLAGLLEFLSCAPLRVIKINLQQQRESVCRHL